MTLKLRKIREQDLNIIMEWRMLPEVTMYMYTDPEINLENQLKWYTNIQNNECCKYWIIEIESKAIGVLSINDIDYKNKKCSWAYYIADTSFRGRGIATSLECNIYDYVFNKLNLNKLCCEVFEFNDKVVSIHKKFGADIEGLLKEHIIKNDKKFNVVVMGILKSKWERIRKDYSYDKISIDE